MKVLLAAISALSAGILAGAAEAPDPLTGWKPPYCVKEKAPADSPTIPRKFGYIMYQAFDMLDVFGTLNVFSYLSWQYRLELYLISETMDPVTVEPLMASMNRMNSSFFPEVLVTHTFESAPKDLDVLFVPGGLGARSPNLNKTVEYIREMAPQVDYFMTVCTGAILASNAGVLDGTTWTSSGVESGMDAALGFIKCLYGKEVAESIADGMEYVRHSDPSFDPFAAKNNVTFP